MPVRRSLTQSYGRQNLDTLRMNGGDRITQNYPPDLNREMGRWGGRARWKEDEPKGWKYASMSGQEADNWDF